MDREELLYTGAVRGKAIVLQWFREWAEAHPDALVSDELWGFVSLAERKHINV